MADSEITAEGITYPETIGRRALEIVERLLHRYKDKEIDLVAAHTAVTAVVEGMLPFVDHGSKEVLTQASRYWDERLTEYREVEAGIATVDTETGGWVTGAP